MIRNDLILTLLKFGQLSEVEVLEGRQDEMEDRPVVGLELASTLEGHPAEEVLDRLGELVKLEDAYKRKINAKE